MMTHITNAPTAFVLGSERRPLHATVDEDAGDDNTPAADPFETVYSK